MLKMKDLLQEGRKIQETFKKNMLNEFWTHIDVPDSTEKRNLISLLKKIEDEASDAPQQDKQFYDGMTRKYSNKLRTMISKVIVGKEYKKYPNSNSIQDMGTITSVDGVYIEPRADEGDSNFFDACEISVDFKFDTGKGKQDSVESIDDLLGIE